MKKGRTGTVGRSDDASLYHSQSRKAMFDTMTKTLVEDGCLGIEAAADAIKHLIGKSEQFIDEEEILKNMPDYVAMQTTEWTYRVLHSKLLSPDTKPFFASRE
jgi:hypothetical protein